MKKQENIRDLFGLTQIEMAMLLKISRAQYSMYESGKRSLPLQANVLLSKMLEYLKIAETDEHKKLPHVIPQENKMKTEMEALLKENQYQLLIVSRNAADVERKYSAHVKALQLVNYLEPLLKTGEVPNFLGVIEITAKKGVGHNGLPKLAKLRIKLAVLQQEELILKAALEKLY